MRPCEICSGSDLEHIHRQHFLFPGQVAPVHYDVVACRTCGFAFASDIPDQSALNSFYQTSEHHLHANVPPGLARIHDDFFAVVRRHVPLSPDTRVLDIGSGMGHFLSRFQGAGLHDLLGIEPSPAAARLGKEIHGLDIRTDTVDTFTSARPFGLVTLCGVLEHIADLQTSVRRIGDLVEEGGHLFIAVPDAATFGTSMPNEAFLEFALEHINFFTSGSLDNLLRQAGFTAMHVESQRNDFYGNSYLLALYRKASGAPTAAAMRPDRVGSASVRAYVDGSRERLQPISRLAAELADSGEPLIVWGAGSLTSRLFCDTRLGAANIRCIIDRNPALQGRKLLDVTITAPDTLKDHPGVTVLIASTTYAGEIATALIDDHHWSGKIISLISPDSLGRP